MRLITAHKILIATALALSLLFTARSTMLYVAAHARSDLIVAFVGLFFALVLGWYLRSLWRR